MRGLVRFDFAQLPFTDTGLEIQAIVEQHELHDLIIVCLLARLLVSVLQSGIMLHTTFCVSRVLLWVEDG